MKMAELGLCRACGHGRFSTTTTRVNKVSIDYEGRILDRINLDLVADIVCERCGNIRFSSEDISQQSANLLLQNPQ